MTEGPPTFYLGAGPSNATDGIYSTFFANPSRVRCCANESDGGPGIAALGYWAPIGIGFEVLDAQGQGGQDFVDAAYSQVLNNFTITWVIGKLFPDEWEEVEGSGENMVISSHYLWSEVPEVLSLNCAPVIENSTATITVTREDEQVVDFAITAPPIVHDLAWSDYFLHHNNSGEDGDDIAYNIMDNVTVR